MQRTVISLLLLVAVAAADDLAPRLRAALVKLQVTSQSYDSAEPWKKRPVRTIQGRGVVIQPGVILTRAANVRDQRMIEISVANSARLYPARLKHVDPRIGLALVEITDPELANQLQPLEIGAPVKLDDEFSIWQLGGDNLLERFTARVVSANAAATRLNLRLKTTCSDKGNGQVALRDGKLVGLMTGTVRSRQEGTILSVETLRHYLDDFADGTYNGCPGAGLWVEPLLRDDLRAFYRLAPDQHGIAISRTMPGRTGDGVLRAGDVLLEVDGFDLDDEGKFIHPVHGRLDASYLFQGRRYAGDRVKAKILRKGKVEEVSFELKSFPAAEMRVPDRPPGGRPQFLMVGGLVILELNGSQSISRSPGGVILRRYKERALWDPPSKRKRIVFVDHVLQDPANKGFERMRYATIAKVNGQTVADIATIAKALEFPVGGFHVFEFEGVESDFVIPADKRAATDQRIAKNYKVTRARYLVGDPE